MTATLLIIAAILATIAIVLLIGYDNGVMGFAIFVTAGVFALLGGINNYNNVQQDCKDHDGHMFNDYCYEYDDNPQEPGKYVTQTPWPGE